MSTAASMAVPVLDEAEFRDFQAFILEAAGISMSAAKRTMVASRLASRVKRLGCPSYGVYFRHLQQDAGERRLAVDLLTVNETYFFREEPHFEFLEKQVLPRHPRGAPMRIWSAASSSGEEACSIAMMLHAHLGDGDWRIFASDISRRILAKARRGVYPMARAERIRKDWLQRYCLKGTGEYAGSFMVDKALRDRIEYAPVNLNEALPAHVGPFDVVFLRNVLIYFNAETKLRVVERIVDRIAPGGILFTGHSESLGVGTCGLVREAPSIYRRAAGAGR